MDILLGQIESVKIAFFLTWMSAEYSVNKKVGVASKKVQFPL
jgi:hypothetical protein